MAMPRVLHKLGNSSCNTSVTKIVLFLCRCRSPIRVFEQEEELHRVTASQQGPSQNAVEYLQKLPLM